MLAPDKVSPFNNVLFFTPSSSLVVCVIPFIDIPKKKKKILKRESWGECHGVVQTCCLFDLTSRICLQGSQEQEKGSKVKRMSLSGNLRRNTLERWGEWREVKQREECNFPLVTPPSSRCHSSIPTSSPPPLARVLAAALPSPTTSLIISISSPLVLLCLQHLYFLKCVPKNLCSVVVN